MPAPVLRFSARYRDAVGDGSKATTVRWAEDVAVGPVLLAFADDDAHAHASLRGRVVAVERHRLDALTPEAAGQPPGTDMTRFAAELRSNHYPAMPDDAEVEVVAFVVLGAAREARGRGRPERDPASPASP